MLKANLWCPDCTCGLKPSDGSRTFQVQVEKENDKSLTTSKCPNNKKITLKHMGFSMLAVGAIDASKKFAGRSPKEREKRRTDDFIKNTLPTLGGSDRKHFEKKFGIDKKTGKRTK